MCGQSVTVVCAYSPVALFFRHDSSAPASAAEEYTLAILLPQLVLMGATPPSQTFWCCAMTGTAVCAWRLVQRWRQPEASQQHVQRALRLLAQKRVR